MTVQALSSLLQFLLSFFFMLYPFLYGAWGGIVVMALCYQSDSPWIDSWWCHWIFQSHIPSNHTMTRGLTQLLVKMSTRNISWGWGWQPHHHHVPNVMEIWEPKPPGTLWATPGLLRDCFTFTFFYNLFLYILFYYNIYVVLIITCFVFSYLYLLLQPHVPNVPFLSLTYVCLYCM